MPANLFDIFAKEASDWARMGTPNTKVAPIMLMSCNPSLSNIFIPNDFLVGLMWTHMCDSAQLNFH